MTKNKKVRGDRKYCKHAEIITHATRDQNKNEHSINKNKMKNNGKNKITRPKRKTQRLGVPPKKRLFTLGIGS